MYLIETKSQLVYTTAKGHFDMRKIAIVGSPNVGKSVLFHKLTGRYVTVSNYPGTTVEVSRGRAEIKGNAAGAAQQIGKGIARRRRQSIQYTPYRASRVIAKIDAIGINQADFRI